MSDNKSGKTQSSSPDRPITISKPTKINNDFGERGGSQPSLTSEAGRKATPPPKDD